MIYNPHLQGEAFFWEGGPVGVLLSHGFTATSAEVRLLAGVLHGHGFSVAGPLLPGHFTDPADLNRVRWQDWLQAVRKDYQRLCRHCRQVFVGGESTGGLLALYLASEQPAVAGILTYAPALRLALRPLDFLRLYMAAPFIPSVPKPDLSGTLPWQGYPVNPLKGTIQLLRLQRALRPRLRRIHQPVLIVQGRQDLTVHPQVPETIASAVSSSVKEIHWMENSTHCVILDQEWEQVAGITLGFMQRVLARTNQEAGHET